MKVEYTSYDPAGKFKATLVDGPSRLQLDYSGAVAFALKRVLVLGEKIILEQTDDTITLRRVLDGSKNGVPLSMAGSLEVGSHGTHNDADGAGNTEPRSGDTFRASLTPVK